MDDLRIYFVTYNVGTGSPDVDLSDLLSLNGKNDKTLPDFYVIGLQEVSAQPHNLLMDALYDDPWTRVLKDVLALKGYIKIKTIRLQGLVLSVFTLRKHLLNIRDVETDYTRTGLSGMWGNKGGVSVRLGIYGCTICFVNAHLCAHDNQLDERIVDYNSIINDQQFHVPGNNTIFFHDYVFLFGDLNFRLREIYDRSPEEIARLIDKGELAELFKYDQLKHIRENKRAFHELTENEPHFPPTFKFEVGKSTYDFKRRPAWTDRILYQVHHKNYNNITLSAKQKSYMSHPKYTLSDHKPVTSEFVIKTPLKAPVRAISTMDSQVFADYGEEVVVFDDIQQWWDDEENTVLYMFTKEYKPNKNDWIGVYKHEFSCLDEYEAYEYIHKNASPTPTPKNKSSPRPPPKTPKEECPSVPFHNNKYNITFSQPSNKNPGNYCLIYISETEDKVRSVLGISHPFPLKNKGD